MARNRQRAADRKSRQRNLDGSVDGVAPDPVDHDPNPIHREMVDGSIEHTGEVDRFEAELVAGAEGEPERDPDAVERAAAGGGGVRGGDGVDLDGGGGEDGGTNGGGAVVAPRAPGTPESTQERGRLATFLRASWAELQRVQWPDRRHVGQATAVVLGFVVVAGAFLGLADVVAEQIVDLLI